MKERHPSRERIRWGEGAARSPFHRLATWARGLVRAGSPPPLDRLPRLPAVLRRGELAERYLAAESDHDHPHAGAMAAEASAQAVAVHAWWPADAWGHRALWHFEQAELGLDAVRAARRIGEIRVMAGDPLSARRYFAEAIGEARDIGSEHEEGRAAYGLGQAELALGNVTTGRRLAQIAVDLFERCGAPADEIAAARQLHGAEKTVGAGEPSAGFGDA